MPNNETEKTESAPKPVPRHLLMAVVVIPIVLIALFVVIAHRQVGPTLRANNKAYHLLVANSLAAQAKGLGDRTSLPTNEAMLFPFKGQAVRCFWMKDTYFPLDMVWLNNQKQIVHIQADVLPSSYPETFCPNELAQYVIELNAGQAQAAGLQIGQKLNF